jgi:homoserine dehydrogenase
MMGGSHPAYDFSVAALRAGKSVVTSNKEVVSTFGVEL